jgi:hypothetical protein
VGSGRGDGQRALAGRLRAALSGGAHATDQGHGAAEARRRSALATATAAEIARIRSRWANDLIADLVEDPGTTWGVQPVMAALERGRVQRIAIAGDVDADIAERLIRRAVASGAELTLADPGALGPLGVAAHPRW